MKTLEKQIYLSQNCKWIQEEGVVIRSREITNSLDRSFLIQEITLGPNTQWELLDSKNRIELLLPLLGEIQLDNGLVLEIGEIWSEFVPKGKGMLVLNTYSKESVHFVRISLPFQQVFSPSFQLFQETKIENQILEIWNSPDQKFKLRLGIISGRTDITFIPQSSTFSLVVAGAFEFQKCLLEHGDGLSIEGVEEIELECLTPEGLVLVLEIDPK